MPKIRDRLKKLEKLNRAKHQVIICYNMRQHPGKYMLDGKVISSEAVQALQDDPQNDVLILKIVYGSRPKTVTNEPDWDEAQYEKEFGQNKEGA